MSKVQLRRELAGLSKDQLIEVVLDAYAARREIKAYFDFFINPDVEKLIDKYEKDIAKEFSRSKWGRSKARISHITRLLKDFEGYNPGAEHVVAVYLFTIGFGMLTEYNVNFPDTLLKGLSKLIIKTLEYADAHGESARVIESFDKLLDENIVGYSRLSRRILKQSIEAYNSAASIKKS